MARGKCVLDYHALSKETIKGKFPIPVVEELLVELHCKTLVFTLSLDQI
jgi:hypothetical protein